MKRVFVWAVCLVSVAFCFSESAFSQNSVLMMATTTSTDNTGLLDDLMPEFKRATGIDVRWTATGTGKALKLGENCDVDIIMVHAPPAEEAFVKNGFGRDRREIMYNDFVIIGPEADPAGIKGESIEAALKAIAADQTVFVSRGDNSGTHKKEHALWKAAGMPIPEKDSWYLQTGQGMLTTINIAAERDGYVMTDRGTYIKYEATLKGDPPLKILVEGDAVLINQYSVVATNKTHCPKAKYDLAKQFIGWMTGSDAQKLIGEFRLLGKPLFTPNAGK